MTRLAAVGETPLALAPSDTDRLEHARELGLRADGTESNVAVAASRLGAAATWVSRLPDTPLGRRVVAELREHGLNTAVDWAEDDRQGLAFCEPGRTPREGAVIEDRAGAAMAETEANALPRAPIEHAETLFVAGSTPALSETAWRTARSLYRHFEGTRVLDLDYRPGLWSVEAAREYFSDVLDAVDVLIARERDVERVLGESGSAREVVHAVAAGHDLDCVVITCADGSAAARVDNVVHEVATVEADVANPAGDHAAFTGAFLAARLDDEPVDAALDRGAAAAALARTLDGPIPAVSDREVQRLVDERTSSGR